MAQVASPTNAAMAARLERDVANLHGELNIAKRKLSSKSEALIILSADLDACRTERDQYKLMAEQLQSRHVAIKKQLAGVVDEGRSGGDLDVDQLWRLLAEHQAKSKSVALEAEDLKQRLAEAEGDNRALREQLGRRRMGEEDEAVSRRSWSSSEREALVATLEEEREKTGSLKRDMREVLDQKEELVVERDALKSKHERLNKEMNLMLKGDPERILDLDALTMENAYLKQELSRMKEEQSKTQATLTKYRNLLEKRMAKLMGAGRAKMILDDHSAATPKSSSPAEAAAATAATTITGLPPGVEALGKKLLRIPPDRASPQAVAHLQKFVVFLMETLQDRSLAITHQRKTNQILGQKIQILEDRLRNQAPPGRSSESEHRDSRDQELETKEDILAGSLENSCLSASQDSGASIDPPDDNPLNGSSAATRNGTNNFCNSQQSAFTKLEVLANSQQSAISKPEVLADGVFEHETDESENFNSSTPAAEAPIHCDNHPNGTLPAVSEGSNCLDNRQQSTFQNLQMLDNSDNDDTLSFADSFCVFQSAATDISSDNLHIFDPDGLRLAHTQASDLEHSDVQAAVLRHSDDQAAVLHHSDLSSSVLHRSDGRDRESESRDSDRNGAPNTSLEVRQQGKYWFTETNPAPESMPSGRVRTPQRENALFKVPQNLKDLLSWDFDDHVDSSRRNDSSSSAILTPTAFNHY